MHITSQEHCVQQHPDFKSNDGGPSLEIKIGCWNVRTLYESGKLDNLKLEMKRLKVNVLGVCETRWTSKGQNDFQSDDYRVIHSGGESHERGVGIILDKERAKCVLGYWLLSDRVMLLKLKGIPFNLAIIMVYAPTKESSEEEKINNR